MNVDPYNLDSREPRRRSFSNSSLVIPQINDDVIHCCRNNAHIKRIRTTTA